MDSIPPGRYSLSRDVVNPSPDRRCNPDRNPLSRKVIPKGTRFRALRFHSGGKWENFSVELRTLPSHDSTGPGSALWTALLPALEPAEDDLEFALDEISPVNGHYLIEHMVETGRLTVTQVRELAAEIGAKWDKEEG